MQDHPQPVISWRHRIMRILTPISILATLLYVVFFTIESISWVREKHPTGPKPPYVVSLQKSVQREITQIGSVPPGLLADTLTNDLGAYDCHWYLACTQRPARTVYNDFGRPCPTCNLEMIPSSEPLAPAQLTYSIGGFPVPTLHTVFGLPRALRITVVKVCQAGTWAILMFLSCAVIYFGLALIWASRAKEIHPFFVLLVLTVSPAAITILASLIEWAATETFTGISWAAAQVVYVIAWSSGASLLVSIPHIYKAPREILEASELIRHV
jgi:hypothetical protein